MIEWVGWRGRMREMRPGEKRSKRDEVDSCRGDPEYRCFIGKPQSWFPVSSTSLDLVQSVQDGSASQYAPPQL